MLAGKLRSWVCKAARVRKRVAHTTKVVITKRFSDKLDFPARCPGKEPYEIIKSNPGETCAGS